MWKNEVNQITRFTGVSGQWAETLLQCSDYYRLTNHITSRLHDHVTNLTNPETLVGFWWFCKHPSTNKPDIFAVWAHSPPWERSRPCRRGFWTHPSKPPPPWGRCVGHERWGPRCKVYGRARCGRCEHRAGPRCCRRTATPDASKRTEQRRDSSTPITVRDSLLHLVSSHDPSCFSTVAPLQLLREDRFSWGICVEPRRRHSPAKSFLLSPSPPLQPGVEGIVLAEKINVPVSRSGSLGPRRLKASQAASYIMKAYSNLEADPSKNVPKFRTLDSFGAVYVKYLPICFSIFINFRWHSWN